MLAVAIFAVTHADTLTPREDEILALFVGRSDLGSALYQVLAERGGAPMHFITAWLVVHLGGHLVALRIVSALFAVAALPLVALLAARMVRDGRVGVVAATLAAPSWLVLFHADFARMYAQFFFFSTLAPLLLLRALDGRRRRAWIFWWLASLAVLASHPYGAFVLAAGIVTVLVTRWGRPRTWIICAVPVVAALPFWVSDIVLRSRFGVGVGGGGDSLGSPQRVAEFVLATFRDAFAHHGIVFWGSALLILGGMWLVVRASGRRERALLAASFGFPLLALLAVRADDNVTPQTRHLVFLLAFLDLFVAFALVWLAERARRFAVPALVVALAVIAVGQVRSAQARTPDLFDGETPTRIADRTRAAEWLHGQGANLALLLGYDPIFYEVWTNDPYFSSYVIARADGLVAAKQLERYCGKFRGAAFVFDRENNDDNLPPPNFERLGQRVRNHGYKAKQFGDFLVAYSPDTRGHGAKYVYDALPILRAARRETIVVAALGVHTLKIAREHLTPGC
jgi:hypothetical protein